MGALIGDEVELHAHPAQLTGSSRDEKDVSGQVADFIAGSNSSCHIVPECTQLIEDCHPLRLAGDREGLNHGAADVHEGRHVRKGVGKDSVFHGFRASSFEEVSSHFGLLNITYNFLLGSLRSGELGNPILRNVSHGEITQTVLRYLVQVDGLRDCCAPLHSTVPTPILVIFLNR